MGRLVSGEAGLCVARVTGRHVLRHRDAGIVLAAAKDDEPCNRTDRAAQQVGLFRVGPIGEDQVGLHLGRRDGEVRRRGIGSGEPPAVPDGSP